MIRHGRLNPGAALAVMALLLASPATAGACSCAPKTPEQSLAATDVIFRGIAVEASEPDANHLVHYMFEVQQPWKGVTGERIEITGGGVICGSEFVLGESWAVFAERDRDGQLYSSTCSGFGLFTAQPEDQERLLPGYTRWGP